MSTADSLIDAQIQHLLQAVEQHRATHCEKIQQLAQGKAAALISKAHKDARARMHKDNISTRAATQQLLVSTEARLQTQKRLARQQSDEELLRSSWELLENALQQQWQQAETRKQWIDKLIEQAISKLVSPHWHIEHPVNWQEQERTAVLNHLHDRLGHQPATTANPDIQAGLRLCTGGTCVDGTADGLLKDSSRIEALMLASIHRHKDRDSETSHD